LDFVENSIESISHVTLNGNIIEGINYFEYPEHFIKSLEETPGIIPTNGNRFLLMHQIVASGLPIEDHIQSDDPLFNRFDMIFNGHIHKSQEISERFINVGSPLHRDASDIGQKKGIWILDLNDPVNTISFKDLTDMFPQYIHVEEGVELDEWQSKQYVIRTPKLTPATAEDKAVVENFKTDLAPAEIMKNYCENVGADKEMLNYGLHLL
jgi:DNA repair exonuclease SbcCD nuclease subunit